VISEVDPLIALPFVCPRCGAGVRHDGKCQSCNLQLSGFSLDKGGKYREKTQDGNTAITFLLT
jgi:hypothetical protein